MAENVSLRLRTSRDSIGIWERAARRILAEKFALLRKGQLIVVEDGQSSSFPEEPIEPGPRATVRVLDPRLYTRVLLGGSLGFAEAYLEGMCRMDDPVAMARLFVANREAMDSVDSGLGKLRAPLNQALHALNRNTLEGSKRNIAAHYDLGNDFFSLFLDRTMMYSCAVFEDDDQDLYWASINKLDRICRKLQLEPGDHVLEIGTGWGGFAIHAAKYYGCKVTTTTISQEQHDLAKKRVAELGLECQIEVLLKDYRLLEGEYDKAVSIEMVEAIGHEQFETYFRQVSHLLKPEGMFLMQAITIEDRYYENARDSVDFMKRYIFPGCCIPSVSALTDAASKSCDMRLFHMDDIGPHYARTLRLWRQGFLDRIDQVRSMGFDERFIRMWNWYLAACEAGYEERLLGNVQMLWVKPDNRRAPVDPQL